MGKGVQWTYGPDKKETGSALVVVVVEYSCPPSSECKLEEPEHSCSDQDLDTLVQIMQNQQSINNQSFIQSITSLSHKPQHEQSTE